MTTDIFAASFVWLPANRTAFLSAFLLMKPNTTKVVQNVKTDYSGSLLLRHYSSSFIRMHYGFRLRRARVEAGLTQKELEQLSGVKQGTISKIEREDQGATSFVVKLANALGVRALWLETGEGPMREGENGDYEIWNDLARPRVVPLVGTTQCGPDPHWIQLGYPNRYGDEYMLVSVTDKTTYALRVRGSSLAPRIKEGEVLVISREAEPVPGEDVVIRLNDGQVLVRQFVNRRPGYITVDSVNIGERIVIEEETVEFIHAVLGIHPASAVKKY